MVHTVIKCACLSFISPAFVFLMQEVMILSHQLSPKPMAFSMPFALRLVGPLDVARLQRSLHIAIARQQVTLTLTVVLQYA